MSDGDQHLNIEGPAPNLLTREMVMALVAVGLMFTGVFLAFPVAPKVVEAASGRKGDAGLVTAVFSGFTVLTQMVMPRMFRSRHVRKAFVWSQLLIGVPGVVFMVAGDNVALLLIATGIRGVGFGIASVLSALVVTARAVGGDRGRAFGYYGVAATVPGVFGSALGLFLEAEFGTSLTFAVVALVGVLAALAASGAGPVEVVPDSPGARTLNALRRPGVRNPALVGLLMTLTFAGVISFAPIALSDSGLGSATIFFLLAGSARAVARWASGFGIDRWGPHRFLAPGALLVVVGALFLAIGDPAGMIMTSAVLYGAGHGLVQNASFLAMMDRAADTDAGVVSTVWNLSIDGGVAVGGLLLGAVAAAGSIDLVFGLLPVIAAIALPIALWEARDASSEPT